MDRGDRKAGTDAGDKLHGCRPQARGFPDGGLAPFLRAARRSPRIPFPLTLPIRPTLRGTIELIDRTCGHLGARTAKGRKTVTPLRLYLVGGFLGAGKTTLLRVLSKYLLVRGERVAVVTNDQSADLVDTRAFEAEGIPVEEVAGACFCCSFEELVGRLRSLSESALPTVILAEPVGSCTDLSATVLQPLKKFYGKEISVGPLTVLVDPERAHRILTKRSKGGFSPKAAYIYRKQLEEADILVVNKIDDPQLLPHADAVEAILKELLPGTPVLRISARLGLNVDTLLDLLETTPFGGRKVLEIDYDIYAEGEAELAWLNARATIRFRDPQYLDSVGCYIADAYKLLLSQDVNCEIAHLKVVAMGNGEAVVCNTTSVDQTTVVSYGDRSSPVLDAEFILNCRAFTSPAYLERAWRTLLLTLSQWTEQTRSEACKAFRPARPVPSYRFATPIQPADTA